MVVSMIPISITKSSVSLYLYGYVYVYLTFMILFMVNTFMRSKSEFFELTNEEIWEEISIRRDLIDMMIGNLYPSVLEGEIETLGNLLKDPQGRLLFRQIQIS